MQIITIFQKTLCNKHENGTQYGKCKSLLESNNFHVSNCKDCLLLQSNGVQCL